MSAFSYRPPIDGLRAIAVMLVVLFHAQMPGLANGFVGVDIFFVISGYLITAILVRERVASGRLGFRTFYARRVKRLLPASLVVLVVTAIAYRLVAPPIDVLDNRAGFGYASIYLANWYFLARAQDYFAAGDAPSPVLHYWSLGVEEQFYLVWPLVLAGILAIAVIRTRWLAQALTLLAVAACVLSWRMDAADATAAYFNTGARAYQLLAGAALAAWMLRRRSEDPPGRVLRGFGTLLVLAAGALLGATIVAGERITPWEVGLAGIIAAVAFLAGIEFQPARPAVAVVSTPTMIHLGRWSYSTYLWHWPVLVIGAMLTPLLAPEAAWFIRVPIAVAISLVLAWITFRCVEQPGQRLSVASPWRSRGLIGGGLLASVGAAVLALAVLQVPASAQQLADVAAQGQTDQEDGVVTIEIAGAAVAGVPSPSSSSSLPSSKTGPSPGPSSGPSSGPSPGATDLSSTAPRLTRPADRVAPSTVMLVGDSHAQMWRAGFNASAQRLGFTGIMIAEPGCPWMDIPALSDRTGELHRCQQTLLKPILEAARTYQPDVVILASRSVLSRRLLQEGRIIRAGEPGWQDLVRKGVAASLAKVANLSGQVVLLEPYPMTAEPMIRCLSTGAKPASCDLPATALPGTPFVEQLYAEQAARFDNVTTVSLDEVICPKGTCPAKVGSVVTFADDNHLTADYAARLMPALLRELAAAGITVRGTGGGPVVQGGAP